LLTDPFDVLAKSQSLPPFPAPFVGRVYAAYLKHIKEGEKRRRRKKGWSRRRKREPQEKKENKTHEKRISSASERAGANKKNPANQAHIMLRNAPKWRYRSSRGRRPRQSLQTLKIWFSPSPSPSSAIYVSGVLSTEFVWKIVASIASEGILEVRLEFSRLSMVLWSVKSCIIATLYI